MSFIADIFSARTAARGQERAADVARDTSAASIAEQRRQYDLSRQDMQPWLSTGTGALNTLAGLYGLNSGGAPQSGGSGMTTQQYLQSRPDALQAINQGNFGGPGNLDAAVAWHQREDNAARAAQGLPPLSSTTQGADQPATAGGNTAPFFASPDYQFRLDEAMRGLTARNAALGIQDSGAAQRSALTLAGNQASGEFNNYANRLAGLAGVGQTAASQNAAVGQNYAGAITNINTNLGQQLGSSYINRGNIYGNLFSNLGGQAQRAGQAFLGGF